MATTSQRNDIGDRAPTISGAPATVAGERPKDYLGRRLHRGDVVVYAILVGGQGGHQPLRRGVVLAFDDARAWIRTPGGSGVRDATVRIAVKRVIAIPDALPARVVGRLRAHRLRRRKPSASADRVLGPAGRYSPPVSTSPTITPEATLRAAGIDDARQAEYQRKMSVLLAGRT
jgi:hypothetical protein